MYVVGIIFNQNKHTKSLYSLNYPHTYLMRVPSVALVYHVS